PAPDDGAAPRACEAQDPGGRDPVPRAARAPPDRAADGGARGDLPDLQRALRRPGRPRRGGDPAGNRADGADAGRAGGARAACPHADSPRSQEGAVRRVGRARAPRRPGPLALRRRRHRRRTRSSRPRARTARSRRLRAAGGDRVAARGRTDRLEPDRRALRGAGAADTVARRRAEPSRRDRGDGRRGSSASSRRRARAAGLPLLPFHARRAAAPSRPDRPGERRVRPRARADAGRTRTAVPRAAKIRRVTPDPIADFRRELQRAAAERVVPTPNGTAILAPSIRDVYDANYLSVETASAGADVLVAEAEAVLETSHHRRVIVEDGSPGLADDFADLGYERQTHLVLVHAREPDRLVDTSGVREVPLDALIALRTQATLREPWGDDDIAHQLDVAKAQIANAVATRFFAATAGDRIAGWCELRLRGGVAQIEDVEVVEEFRGRGLGRSVVQHALSEARAAAEIVFLEALAHDWPRELYAKLGFDVVGRRDFYTRLPHPLTRVRLRRARLELRLPTISEVRALYQVAKAGIHDPAEMPFEVPWTDTLNEDDFVAYHRERREFVAFLDGLPIGVQALRVEGGEAVTGSWLGAAYQGQGLGTEMRATVLTLAFERYGVSVARS